jgi:RNA polymerase sigma factor (sigma-70 family)
MRNMDAALAVLYRQRYHAFLRVAEGVVGERELARDVVQDAFARLVRSQSTFRGDGTLEGWVWRAVVNAARSARRAEQVRQTGATETAEIAQPDEERLDEEVRALLTSLPERQRLVLFLRYYADLDYRSIAEVLGIESGTVAATLNQGRAALRRMLKEVPR